MQWPCVLDTTLCDQVRKVKVFLRVGTVSTINEKDENAIYHQASNTPFHYRYNVIYGSEIVILIRQTSVGYSLYASLLVGRIKDTNHH